MLQHPRHASLNFCSSMFPMFYDALRIQWLGILLELGWEFSHLSLSLIQILLEHFIHFIFALINIKSQSDESFFSLRKSF